MLHNTIRLVVILLLLATTLKAQQPQYTRKLLRASGDESFKNVNAGLKNGKLVAKTDGKVVAYISGNTNVYDVDDDNKTSIMISGRFLQCLEGAWKNGKREGLFYTYVIDSLDREHRYKIAEQQYKNDRLNGAWRRYNLKGNLVASHMYENDSLKGIGREYTIFGKVQIEREFLGSSTHYIDHQFYPDGKLERTITIQNDKKNGIARAYYPDGKLMEEVNFKNDEFDGTRKYFYPNGNLWIEQVYKNGLSWSVVGNFTADGKTRNAGTLKNGNGTIILYKENGGVESVTTFKNGVEQ
jgi:antitoxin component YwqK of YwqJK toxin-antitoxin module